LTETYGWQAEFWINPPLASVAVGLLWVFAPKDNLEPRRLDVLGAAIIAVALGALAWALSQIGVSPSAASSVSVVATVFVAGLGAAGVGLYAWWERLSDHPMTPPRLGRNRAFVGLNAATLLIYSGLSIMFFLVPFDLVDRRGLPSIRAGLTFMPFTVGVGLLSQPFGSPRGRYRCRENAYRGTDWSGRRVCLDGDRA
jgi:hypothetical protein